jgi:hypothetical protein
MPGAPARVPAAPLVMPPRVPAAAKPPVVPALAFAPLAPAGATGLVAPAVLAPE